MADWTKRYGEMLDKLGGDLGKVVSGLRGETNPPNLPRKSILTPSQKYSIQKAVYKPLASAQTLSNRGYNPIIRTDRGTPINWMGMHNRASDAFKTAHGDNPDVTPAALLRPGVRDLAGGY